jgi:hypothetical protein
MPSLQDRRSVSSTQLTDQTVLLRLSHNEMEANMLIDFHMKAHMLKIGRQNI